MVDLSQQHGQHGRSLMPGGGCTGVHRPAGLFPRSLLSYSGGRTFVETALRGNGPVSLNSGRSLLRRVFRTQFQNWGCHNCKSFGMRKIMISFVIYDRFI